MPERYAHLSEIYKLFGNPTRLAIVDLLRKGECSVGDMKEALGLSEVTLAQHLARLRRLKVVKVRRIGVRAHYELADPRIATFYDLIEEFYRHTFTS